MIIYTYIPIVLYFREIYLAPIEMLSEEYGNKRVKNGKDVSFNCSHCRIAVPSVSKILAKILSFEEKFVEVNEVLGSIMDTLKDTIQDKEMIRKVIRRKRMRSIK